jgi:hypothetical protein
VSVPAALTQVGPSGVCRRRPRARGACWNRERIRNGFLHYVALVFTGILRQGTPWFELRLLLDDHVPATRRRRRGDPTGRKRQRGVRDDFIHDISLVVAALLAATQIKCLRIGQYVGNRRKHGFVGLSVGTIMRCTKLSRETVSRILSLLRDAGLCKGPGQPGDEGLHIIAQPYDVRPDGSKENHPAIRQFTELFWSGLGPGVREQLHQLRNPKKPKPDDVSAAHVLSRRAERAREQRARQARPPDG